MPISEVQRAERRRYLGSSDAAAIIGVDPFKTAADVFWDKTSDTVKQKKSASMEAGSFLERAIIDYAVYRLKLADEEIRRNHFAVASDGILCANHDAVIERIVRQGIEAKYTSQHSDWGDEGSDDVPDHVYLQCQHQCFVSALDCVWVPVLMITSWGASFKLYYIPREESVINALVEKELVFWRNHIEREVPPDGVWVPPLSVVKAIRRESGTIVELNERAAVAWESLEDAKSAIKAAIDFKDAKYAAVLALLGKAESGQLPDGRVISYLEQSSTPSVDHAVFKAKAPEVYDQCVERGRHRVLRIKKSPVKVTGRRRAKAV